MSYRPMRLSGAKMINKIVRKSMNKKKGLLLAIVVLLVISSLFVGISHFVYDTMDKNYTQMKIDSNVEDFRMYPLPVTEADFKQMYDQEYITDLEQEFKVDLELEQMANYKSDAKEQRNYTLIKYNPDDNIDKVILEDGELPTAKNEIFIQPQAATQIGVSIGDTLEIGNVNYTISGTGYLIEYVMPADFANNVVYPDFDKFMPVLLSEQGYEQLDQDSDNLTFSQVYKGKFDNEVKDIKDRLEINEKMTKFQPLDVPVLDDNGMPQMTATGEMVTEEQNRFLFTLDRDINPTISSVSNEIQGSQTTFTFLAGLLSIITIFLATILVNSVFKSQRREIGIMKAEGVSIPKLGFGFALYMTVVIVVSGIIGSVLSTFGANAFRGLYAETFMLKDYLITNDTIKLVASDLAKIGIVMIIAIYFISIRKNLNTPTLQLIKNINSEKAPKHNVGKLFKRLSFVRKYQLNLALRNLSKTVLLGFAVLISSFLILLGILMYDSVHNMMGNMFGENFTYSYAVMYSQDNIKNEDEVENGFINKSIDLVSVPREDELEEPLTGEETVTIEAYDFDNNPTVNLNDLDGNPITNDDQGLIATSGFMKNYNLQVGDEITVKNPYDGDGAEVTLEIVNETNDFFLPYVYMPIDTFHSTFDIRDNLINGYYATEPLTAKVQKQVSKDDAGAFIRESADMEDMMGDSLRMLNVAIVIIGVLASIIAFVALYSISSVIIESNSKTISVMKVLGYSTKEIRRMTIGIYKWLVILIYVLSIPLLQTSIQTIVNLAMADMDFTIPIRLNVPLSLLGLIIIYGVYMIASTLTYRKIQKIKLAESLKADE